MSHKTLKKLQISPRLECVLDQLEQVTKAGKEITETPAHGGEDGREEKEFPRVLGHA